MEVTPSSSPEARGGQRGGSASWGGQAAAPREAEVRPDPGERAGGSPRGAEALRFGRPRPGRAAALGNTEPALCSLSSQCPSYIVFCS